QTITVTCATSDGSATTADGDYTAVGPVTLTFAPGETTKRFSVPVAGDTKFEPTETFNVNLTNPVNAAITAHLGTGTITNDDSQPTVSINDVTANEGNSGSTAFVFTVSLSNASSQTVTVDYSTSDGTASTSDNDYTAVPSGTVTFSPGQ